jgi:uncharacterized SAM-binding protein YcdF (DUF218 family)
LSFIVSKLAWLLLQPSNLLLLGLLVALLLGWRRVALALVLLLAAVVVLPVGLWLRQPLEDRFPRPASLPAEVAGIVVLGGAQESDIALSRGVLAVGDGAERLIEGLALAYRYPEAELVFSGGSGALFPGEARERDVNQRFVELMRFDPDRVVYEDRSRNTWENARFTRELVEPTPDEVWLLVTSAAHMPRSMGIFRRIGWPVVAWPVDYQTGDVAPELQTAVSGRLDELDDTVREWLGLLFYRLTDRTDALFPAP